MQRYLSLDSRVEAHAAEPQQLDAVGPRDPEDEFVSPLQGFVGPVGSEHCPAALQTLRAGQRERAVAMLTAREQARKLWCHWQWPGDDVGWTVEGMVPLRQWWGWWPGPGVARGDKY